MEPGDIGDHETAWILCDVVDVGVSLGAEAGFVTLREQEGTHREVSMAIGMAEAVGLQRAREARLGQRPSTHELFVDVLQTLRVEVAAVRIHRYTTDAFRAKLVLMAQQESVVVDARPSDALILAARQVVPSPILVSDQSFSESTR
jgi:uncharacterized protein